jgi:hypothetical protein
MLRPRRSTDQAAITLILRAVASFSRRQILHAAFALGTGDAGIFLNADNVPTRPSRNRLELTTLVVGRLIVRRNSQVDPTRFMIVPSGGWLIIPQFIPKTGRQRSLASLENPIHPQAAISGLLSTKSLARMR